METQSRPVTPDEIPQRTRNGWIVGIIVGITAVLLALPPVRYTLLAQLQFAVAERNLPYLHSLTVRPSRYDLALFDKAAAAAPDDYLVQVGRATAMAAESPRKGSIRSGQSTDETLFRLGELVRKFPNAPGAFAHLARYMMFDRIRGERTVSPPKAPGAGGPRLHTEPVQSAPDPDDVRMTGWALRTGERKDPDNAFWPAMLAVTYFAAHRDEDGEEALRRASIKPRWDAYIYEEILGEWRLYSAALGDNGAIQKVGPLSLVAFPHLREIRKMAQFVAETADNAASNGDFTKALQLRKELILLGNAMANRSQWAYEALIGTDVCIIGASDSRSPVAPGAIRSLVDWGPEGADYIALLRRHGMTFDVAWVRRVIDGACALRNRIDVARYDASFPGIPPGIPLAPLFGDWMAGVCVIQQVGTLLIVLGLVIGLQRLKARSAETLTDRYVHRAALGLLWLIWICSGFIALEGASTPGYMLAFLLVSIVLAVQVLNWFILFARHRKALPSTNYDAGAVSDAEPGSSPVSSRGANILPIAAGTLTLVPSLMLLWSLRGFLSTLHPVAGALTSIVDMPHSVGPAAMLQVAAIASIAPLSLIAGLSLWAAARGITPIPLVARTMRKAAGPAILCFFLAYVVMLDRTIALDGEASKAISEAASNDLQWVLTHSGGPADSAP